MKLPLLAFLCFLSTSVFSQNYDRATLLPQENMVGHVICDNPKNGIVIAGFYGDKGLLYSVDDIGNVLWRKSIDFNQPNFETITFFDLKATTDSNFVAVGNYVNDNTLDKEGFLIKFSSSGDTLWQRFMRGGPAIQFNNAVVCEMADSSYLVVWGNSIGGDGISMCKIDNNGNEIWSKGYSFANQTTVTGLRRQTDSTFILSGDVYFGNGDNGLLAQISDSGAINWANSYIDLKVEDVVVDTNELFLAGFRTTDNIRFVASTSDSGVFNWMKSTSADMYDTFGATSTLIKISDSTLVQYSPHKSDASIATKVRTSGIVDASYEVSMFKNDMMPTSNGGVLFVGNGPVHGIKSLFIYHIGMIQRDSLFADGTCFWSIPVDSATMNVPNLNILAPIAANAPSTYQRSTSELSAEVEFIDGCVYYIGGLDESDIQSFVTVYPNVSSGEFKFDISIMETVDLRIYTSTGTLLIEEKGFIGSTSVDLTKYADGAYYYQVSTQEGLSNSGTLILQK